MVWGRSPQRAIMSKISRKSDCFLLCPLCHSIKQLIGTDAGTQAGWMQITSDWEAWCGIFPLPSGRELWHTWLILAISQIQAEKMVTNAIPLYPNGRGEEGLSGVSIGEFDRLRCQRQCQQSWDKSQARQASDRSRETVMDSGNDKEMLYALKHGIFRNSTCLERNLETGTFPSQWILNNDSGMAIRW